MRVAMIGPFGLEPKGTMRARALPLAQALALCASLNLGVMLDIKVGPNSQSYMERIADLERMLGNRTD